MSTRAAWLIVVVFLLLLAAFGSARAAAPPGNGWVQCPTGPAGTTVICDQAPLVGVAYQSGQFSRYLCTDPMWLSTSNYEDDVGMSASYSGVCFDEAQDKYVPDPGVEMWFRKLYLPTASGDPPGGGTTVAGLTPTEVVELSWLVIGVWAAAWGLRVLIAAARPS